MSAPVSTWRKPKCKSGKIAFRSQGEANRAIDRIKVENLQAVAATDSEPCRSYRCGCGAWHLTSQAERPNRKTRRKQRAAAPRPRRRRRVRAPKVQRHLTLAPEIAIAPPAPAVPVVFAPTDPITETRRERWERLAAERDRANAECKFPWRAAA